MLSLCILSYLCVWLFKHVLFIISLSETNPDISSILFGGIFTQLACEWHFKTWKDRHPAPFKIDWELTIITLQLSDLILKYQSYAGLHSYQLLNNIKLESQVSIQPGGMSEDADQELLNINTNTAPWSADHWICIQVPGCKIHISVYFKITIKIYTQRWSTLDTTSYDCMQQAECFLLFNREFKASVYLYAAGQSSLITPLFLQLNIRQTNNPFLSVYRHHHIPSFTNSPACPDRSAHADHRLPH